MSSERDPFLEYPFAADLILETKEDWIVTGSLGMDDSVLGAFQRDTQLGGGEVLAMSYLAKKRVEEELYG
jgi:hypothetical protein